VTEVLLQPPTRMQPSILPATSGTITTEDLQPPRLMFSLRARRRLSAIEPHYDHTSEQPKAGAGHGQQPTTDQHIDPRPHGDVLQSIPVTDHGPARKGKLRSTRNRVSEPYTTALRCDDHLDADRVVHHTRLLHPWRTAVRQAEGPGEHDLPNSSQYSSSSHPRRRVGAVRRASDLAFSREPRYGIEP
jgi:hypothetical protein